MPRGRRDANERDIIEALRAAGCTVVQLEGADHAGLHDLLVGTPHLIGIKVGPPAYLLMAGANILLEVKMPGQQLRKDQRAFHAAWVGPQATVTSVAEALAVCGVKAQPIDRAARTVAQTGS